VSMQRRCLRMLQHSPELFPDAKQEERRARAAKIVAYVKKTYPLPKTELVYTTPFELVASVILSAQCTDKKVNAVTPALFARYKTLQDYATAEPSELMELISSITYFQSKARYLIGSAQVLLEEFDGVVPRTEKELTRLPGVAYKTAHVVLGELYDIWEGIPTDTHVRRFALRFELSDRTELTKISKDLEKLVPKEDWKYVNNGLVLYGRYVCSAIPHECREHPLTKIWPEAATRWPKAK
jgi:endonuclease III